MAEMRRRSYLPARRAPGLGWRVACPNCMEPRTTGAKGRCPSCGESLIENLPVANESGSEVPMLLSRPILLPICFVIGTWPALIPSIALSSQSILMALVMFPFIYLGAYWITVPMSLLARWLYRKVHPAEKDGARVFTQMIEIQKAWFDVTKLRTRRGLVIMLRVRASYLRGKRLEVLVRFRGPDGRYLRGELRNYRGDFGEVRIRYQTNPLKNPIALFEKIWMFLPVRALSLPPGTDEVHLTAEILVGVGGTVHVERDLAIHFKPMPEDFPYLLPSRGISVQDEGDDGAGMTIVAGSATGEGRHCPICGDTLVGEVVSRCSLCDTPHHPECWEYNTGCSTYACEGRPQNE